MAEAICEKYAERVKVLKDPLAALMSVKAKEAWRRAREAKPKTLEEFYKTFGAEMSKVHHELMACSLE